MPDIAVRWERPQLLTSCLLVVLLLQPLCFASGAETRSSVTLEPFVKSFFEKNCYRCHGETQQKGDRRFDKLPSQVRADSAAAELLEAALDAMNRGDMPPRKKDVVQPPVAETRQVIQWITNSLERLSANNAANTTMMRRLNRFEYTNTLRDLLGLHTEYADPTSDFPVDATEHGFDTNGEALTLSNYQLQRYVEVAETALSDTCYFGAKQPQKQVWRFSAQDFNGVTSYERAPVTWRLIVDDKYMEIGHGQPSERAPNYAKRFAHNGVPAAGWYTVRVRASAANRLDHGYEHREFERYRQQPLKMALWIAPEYKFLGKTAADQRVLVKVWDLPDDTPKVFTVHLWLGKGAIPFVSWTNGVSSKGNIRRVAEKHHPEVIRATKTEIDAAQLGDKAAQQRVAELLKNKDNKLLSEVYHGPRIRLWGMEIEGPTYPKWPPASHRMLFGEETDAAAVDVDQALLRFATRAFRQPVKPTEVEHYAEFIQQQIESGASHDLAIRRGFAAVLTSPRFLYLDEGNEEASSKATAFEIANRLSYFLWSSMPDPELFRLANSGKLLEPSQLRGQVERMLCDDKAAAFVEHFTDTWLGLNKLGTMPPDGKAFATYYSERLESSFKAETRQFFAELIHENGSVLNFLDSDYTFVNGALARHYGIAGVTGEQFRRVSFSPEDRRGGLLGQGSVLTLTANGIETSPVVRGIWVLENILGTPPPPPPPDVEPLEPDTRGTTTIREQLLKHRNVAACADCHQKIDPAGFALEFFDPVGGFRSHYRIPRGRGPAIDGTGQLPTGERFEDERDLKRLLLARKERFTVALTEKLLAYATGRTMTFRDQQEIQEIAAKCHTDGYGLRDLIIRIVASKIFQTR